MNGPLSSAWATLLRNKWISNTWWILNLGNLELSLIFWRNLCEGQFPSRDNFGDCLHVMVTGNVVNCSSNTCARWSVGPRSGTSASKNLTGLTLPEELLQCQARSQSVFSGKPGMISRDHFVCPLPSISEMRQMKEIGWRKVLGFQKNW